MKKEKKKRKFKLNGRQRYLIIRNGTIIWILSMIICTLYLLVLSLLKIPVVGIYDDIGWFFCNIMCFMSFSLFILLPLIGDGMEMSAKLPILFEYLFEDYSECKLRFERAFKELEYIDIKEYKLNGSNKIIFCSKCDNVFRPKRYLFSQNTYAILNIDNISMNDINNIFDLYYKYLEEMKFIKNGGYYYFTLLVCSNKRNNLLRKLSLKHLFLGVDEEAILVNINLFNKKIYLPDADSLLTKKFKEIFNLVKKD